MSLRKCPRCELNYILDDQPLCTVCRREVKGDPEPGDVVEELCSECGEHPALPGGEYCMMCFKQLNNRLTVAQEDTLEAGDAAIGIDSVSTMDEIELDMDDDMEGETFPEDEFEEELPAAASQEVSFEEVFEKETSEDDEEEEE